MTERHINETLHKITNNPVLFQQNWKTSYTFSDVDKGFTQKDTDKQHSYIANIEETTNSNHIIDYTNSTISSEKHTVAYQLKSTTKANVRKKPDIKNIFQEVNAFKETTTELLNTKHESKSTKIKTVFDKTTPFNALVTSKTLSINDLENIDVTTKKYIASNIGDTKDNSSKWRNKTHTTADVHSDEYLPEMFLDHQLASDVRRFYPEGVTRFQRDPKIERILDEYRSIVNQYGADVTFRQGPKGREPRPTQGRNYYTRQYQNREKNRNLLRNYLRQGMTSDALYTYR